MFIFCNRVFVIKKKTQKKNFFRTKYLLLVRKSFPNDTNPINSMNFLMNKETFKTSRMLWRNFSRKSFLKVKIQAILLYSDFLSQKVRLSNNTYSISEKFSSLKLSSHLVINKKFNFQQMKGLSEILLNDIKMN